MPESEGKQGKRDTLEITKLKEDKPVSYYKNSKPCVWYKTCPIEKSLNCIKDLRPCYHE